MIGGEPVVCGSSMTVCCKTYEKSMDRAINTKETVIRTIYDFDLSCPRGCQMLWTSCMRRDVHRGQCAAKQTYKFGFVEGTATRYLVFCHLSAWHQFIEHKVKIQLRRGALRSGLQFADSQKNLLLFQNYNHVFIAWLHL